MRNKLMKMFEDYFNNFLTIERFAEYYGITRVKAVRVIVIGKELHDRRAEKLQAEANQ